VAITSHRVRVDLGKVIMVATCGVILFFDLSELVHRGASGTAGALRTVGTVLVLAFYALAIWCFLRRGPAVATSGSVTAHAAALLASWLPFTVPLVSGPPPPEGRQALADVLVVCGTAWAVWSLRFLDRNVSVLAQARDVVDRGPYRWVRHPLYVGEIVSSLGVAVAANSYPAFGLWLALCGLQAYRAVREEQVLAQALPAYRNYRSRTAALVPGLF
jgi:protein-S-isoprenylcysteine O-methyltransferase Ste14